MRVTRRFSALVATGLTLAVLAVVVERPLLLLATAGIGAYLLALQYAFVRRLQRLDEGLAIDLSVPQLRLTEDETTPVTLQAATIETSLSVTVEATTPASASSPPATDRRVTPEGRDPVTTTFEVSWPVVGTITFDQPTVTVEDAHGLFAETIERGPTPEVTVEPNNPRRLHVGQGGDKSAATFGEHTTGQLGEGLDPAELRQYVSGDSASDIDWKATARLNEPYVREHEVETDRRTVLLVDHRARLGEGPPGETKLDYLREVAIAFAGQASDLDDPLGLYTVGDDGLTTEWQPSTSTEGYRAITDSLYDLTPTAATDEPSEPTSKRSPGSARRAHTALQGDSSAFGTTLRPYLRDTGGYVTQIESDPLFATVQTYLRKLGGSMWTFVFTDDQHRTELREAVKLARADGDHVVVFLTPTVLFEPGGLSDLDAAYERYADFEAFRRGLSQLDRVNAFEVGPGDRLAAVLGSRR